MPQRGYKVKSFVSSRTKAGKEYRSYSLTVPNEIAEQLPKGIKFILKVTEEGLLYVPEEQAEGLVELPAWAQQQPNGKENK